MSSRNPRIKSIISRSFLNSILSTGLGGRVFRGGVLMCAGSAVEQAVRFVRNMILTRLLMPEAIGIMAIILAVNAAFESFTDVGIREAVVQHSDSENRSFLNTAWWFAVIRGSMLSLTGFLITPLIVSFYHIAESYRGLLMASFLAILFNGAISTRAFVALKKMRYDLWITITQGAALGGVCITLVLVWLMRDLHALVYGYIAEALLRFILSFIVCPFVPGLTFEKSQSSEFFHFTRGMAGVPCLTFLFLQVDIFVLGTIVDKHSLGIYGMAGSLAAMPALLISVIVNPILMPAFAQIRGQLERINAALVKVTRIVSLMGFPVCAWVLLFGSEIMRIVYGPDYAHAGHVLAILFFASFLRTLASPIPAIYIGIGQPAKNRLFTAVRTGIILLIIYPGVFFYGLTGAASAGAIAMILAWLFQARQMKTLSNLNRGIYSLSIVTGLFGACAVAGISLVLRTTLGASLLSLSIAGVLCVIVILVTLVLVMYADRPQVYGDGSVTRQESLLSGKIRNES